jgi:PLP dependent protein
MNTIAFALQAIRSRIARAEVAAGRAPGSVALLAVSKTFPAAAVAEAAATGQRSFGENYIQEAVEKITALREQRVDGSELEWHCIGPIQSNKTRLVAEHFDWAHTVDRLKIAQRLSEQRPDDLPPLKVCIQVNVDGSASKSGVSPDEVQGLAAEIAQLPRLQLRGLMCIPDPADDAALLSKMIATKHCFTLAGKQFHSKHFAFDTLSMGMSADLELAIRAGSTMVRVGSAIFGARG